MWFWRKLFAILIKFLYLKFFVIGIDEILKKRNCSDKSEWNFEEKYS